ncbi:MFS transporter [Pseudoroseomonas wenyumeiae]
MLGPIGHYLRTHVAETPAFSRTIVAEAVAQTPLREAITTQRVPLLIAFAISISPCVLYWMFLVYLPTFAQQQMHLSPSSTFFSTTLAGLLYLILTPLAGALSDRIGRKPLLYACSIGSIVLGYPLFSLLVSWGSFGACC